MVISEKIDTNFNRDSFNVNNISKSGNFFKTIIPKNNTVGNSPFRIPNIENKKTFLMTSLPFSSRIKNDDYIHSENPLYNIRRKNNEISTRKIFVPVEAQKVNIKLKGYNFQKDKIFREIRTAEMLPLLKNGNYHQMREFFDIKIPINKEIEKRHREDISIYSTLLLLNLTDLNVQNYGAIILRKIFLTSEKEISNKAEKFFYFLL